MEAGRRGVTDIFNRSRILEIPFFQRSYVWEKDQWERFADDMLMVSSKPGGYFLGSVILKSVPTPSTEDGGDFRAVVDGQQRLTTLLLLFRVVCDARDENEFFDDTFYTYRKQLILRHNHMDSEAFEAIVNGNLPANAKDLFGGSNVYRAYQYFESRKDELSDIDPIQLVERLYFVGIDLHYEEDEQQIFDTINSLGVDLTTAELLKNELFGRSDVKLYESTWKKAFEADPDTTNYWTQRVTAGRTHRENVDLFLQAFLAIQPNAPDDVRVEDLYSAYKEHLTKLSDRHALVNDLTAAADTYRKHIDPGTVDREIDADNSVERLNLIAFGLQTSTIIPFILHVLRKVDSSSEQHAMIGMVESYIMRRLICKDTSKNYNKHFGRLIRNGVCTAQDLAAELVKGAESESTLPDDTRLEEAFLTSNLTNKQAHVALYLIESRVRDEKKHSTALNGLTHYSLEHLMPKKWPNHWGSLDEKAAQKRDQALLKLGNLSLLASSLNISVRDSAWKDKKQGKGGRHGLRHYAAGLETLADALELEVWDESAIEARATQLSGWAKETWPRPVVA